jgi:hypothetical protein
MTPLELTGLVVVIGFILFLSFLSVYGRCAIWCIERRQKRKGDRGHKCLSIETDITVDCEAARSAASSPTLVASSIAPSEWRRASMDCDLKKDCESVYINPDASAEDTGLKHSRQLSSITLPLAVNTEVEEIDDTGPKSPWA